MNNNDFKADLADGKKAEQLYKYILLCSGITHVVINESKVYRILQGYDLIYYINGQEVKVEVKHDRIAEQSGKFAIEARYNGKDSGISITKAKYYAILKENIFYVIKTEKLKQLIESNQYRCIESKNATTFFYLVDCIDVAMYGKTININDVINRYN